MMSEKYVNPLNLSCNQKFIAFFGGLGNQLYIYAFMRWMQQRTHETYLMDDAWAYVFTHFDKDVQRQYYKLRHFEDSYAEALMCDNSTISCSLESIFNVRLPLLRRYIDERIWKDMINKYIYDLRSIPQSLHDMGYPVTVFAEKVTGDFKPSGILNTGYAFSGQDGIVGCEFYGNAVMIPRNIYLPDIAHTQGMIYYHGNWLVWRYVMEVRDILLQELKFPEITDERNKNYAKQITETNSVCIHVRRWENNAVTLTPQHYVQVVSNFEEKLSDLTYFIFSYEPQWCKEHLAELGLGDKKVVFVEGNTGDKAWRDMQLMSMCKHMFVIDSTFCNWAFFFRQRDDGMVITLGG